MATDGDESPGWPEELLAEDKIEPAPRSDGGSDWSCSTSKCTILRVKSVCGQKASPGLPHSVVLGKGIQMVRAAFASPVRAVENDLPHPSKKQAPSLQKRSKLVLLVLPLEAY